MKIWKHLNEINSNIWLFQEFFLNRTQKVINIHYTLETIKLER